MVHHLMRPIKPSSVVITRRSGCQLPGHKALHALERAVGMELKRRPWPVKVLRRIVARLPIPWCALVKIVGPTVTILSLVLANTRGLVLCRGGLERELGGGSASVVREVVRVMLWPGPNPAPSGASSGTVLGAFSVVRVWGEDEFWACKIVEFGGDGVGWDGMGWVG